MDLNILMFVDALFHFGHSPIMSCIPQNLKDKIYFIKLKCNLNINTIIKNINSYLIKDKIGLLSTIQHVNQLNEIREKLQLISNKVFIIKKGDKRIEYPGQIIGCNFSTARKCLEVGCEEFIYVGSGLFHPIGISISTSKNVVCINPYTLSIENVNNRNFFLKRHAIISNLLNSKASKYGILITTKIGQQRIQLANEIYNKIVELKLEAYIIILDLITPEQIRSFDVDAFINTACPRISIDDSNLFHVPLITHYEFKIIIGELEWENLKMDEIIEP